MADRASDLALAEPDHGVAPADRARPMSLSVVIPALNEENGIDEILGRVLAQRDGLADVGIHTLEVLVVDDGSKDKTADRVRAHHDVRLIQHPVNKGYGAALK